MNDDLIDASHVWDRETVHNVSRLRFDVHISHEVLARARFDVEETTRAKCAGALAEAARTFGVEVDRGDVRLRLVEEGEHSDRYQARWSPRVRTVMLRGGEQDGVLVEVRDPFEPLRVAVSPPVPLWARPDEDLSQVAPAPQAVTYSLAGWSERSRHWVLECQ